MALTSYHNGIQQCSLGMADLEADGKIYRTGKMRDGQPVFALTKSSGSDTQFS